MRRAISGSGLYPSLSAMRRTFCRVALETLGLFRKASETVIRLTSRARAMSRNPMRLGAEESEGNSEAGKDTGETGAGR